MPTSEPSPGQKPAPDAASELDDLLAGVAAGDRQAATELYEKYSKHFLRVLRRKYLVRDCPLRRFCDSVTVLQEAWHELILELTSGTRFPSEAEFTSFMEVLLRNNVIDLQRHLAPALKHTASPAEPGAQSSRWEDHSPGPAEQAETADERHHLEGLLNEHELQVLAGMRCGETTAEIASRLGIGVRTVERDLERIRGLAQGGEGTDWLRLKAAAAM